MIAAVVPAAGASKRMGRPKLLIDLGGQTVIGRVVRALRAGGVTRVVVITPPVNTAEGPAVAEAARSEGAEILIPAIRPAEMRESIEYGIDSLARGSRPESVMITPADFPGIVPETIGQLVRHASCYPESLVIPTNNGRRGHPIVLPWNIAVAVRSLPAGFGLNALVAQYTHLVAELPISHLEVVRDLDTPGDLEYWQDHGHFNSTRASGIEVTVRLFALAKEMAGRSELAVELESGSTVAELRTVLADRLPALASLVRSALIAVDEEYASDTTVISPGSRLALIPPVSGGGWRSIE